MTAPALASILERAARAPRRIVLPEGEDARVQAAAVRLAALGIAEPVLLGDPDRVGRALEALGGTGLGVVPPEQNGDLGRLADALHAARASRGMTAEEARRRITDPIVQAAMRVREGLADGTVGGAVATTAETVRAALQLIGAAPGTRTVSSFFLMAAPQGHALAGHPMVFADCGLVVAPDAGQLADIALASAASFKALFGGAPRVAFLSFSTHGSADHASLARPREALAIARMRAPALALDGELQLDAALDPAVRARKAPGSPLDGPADVLVFPDLASGNIGYKIAERIGGLTAVGPILQGLARPANDLSRGCSADDIVAAAAVTVLQAG